MQSKRGDDEPTIEEEEACPYPSQLYVDWEPPYVCMELVDVAGEPILQIWNRLPVGFAVPRQEEA